MAGAGTVRTPLVDFGGTNPRCLPRLYDYDLAERVAATRYGDPEAESEPGLTQLRAPRRARTGCDARGSTTHGEILRHTAEVAAALRIRRARRVSHHEYAVMRSAYREALDDPRSPRSSEQREHVFDALCEAFPELWQRTPASPDRRTPDGDSLRPHLAKIARELALQSEHTSTKSDAAAPATVAVQASVVT